MVDYETRLSDAKGFHAKGLHRVKTIPEPSGQKFPVGSRVRIADKLPCYKSHFHSGVCATVEYTYAHAYGGDNIKSYSLDIDGIGSVSWYDEGELTEIQEDI